MKRMPRPWVVVGNIVPTVAARDNGLVEFVRKRQGSLVWANLAKLNVGALYLAVVVRDPTRTSPEGDSTITPGVAVEVARSLPSAGQR